VSNVILSPPNRLHHRTGKATQNSCNNYNNERLLFSTTSTLLFSSTSPPASSRNDGHETQQSPNNALSSSSSSTTTTSTASISFHGARDAVAVALQNSAFNLSELYQYVLVSSARSRSRLTLNHATTNISESVMKTKLLLQKLNVAAKHLWEEYWWTTPMVLLLVPLYCGVILQSHASMPSWWPVTNMDHHIAAKTTTLGSSASSSLLSSTFVVLGTFLGSNIAYFVSSIYLAVRFGLIRWNYNDNAPTKKRSTIDNESKQQNDSSVVLRVQWPPAVPSFAFLGLWVGLAGIVSTIFHSVQAFCGSRGFAETLCYVDHAVAVTAICYFWKICGRQQRQSH
jgi:hypothetical protein